MSAHTNAINMARDRKFIVGSIDPNGYYSISSRPIAHEDAKSAMQECHRLANMKPGTAFVVMQLAGGAYLPPIQLGTF